MFHGSIVAMVTPMDEQGAIDYPSVSKLVDFHVNNGTDAILVAGTTGEAATMGKEEHHQLIRHVVEQLHGRMPVIAGSGSANTAHAIALTYSAMEAGADACLLLAPPYVKPTQEGMYQHFNAIAKAVAIPQIIYNVPSRTSCDVLAETVIRLANVPNIVGIKEATGDLQRAKDIMGACHEKLDVYSGDDPTSKDLMLNGAKGVISVSANVAPQLVHDLSAAAIAGDIAQANAIDERLQPLNKALFIESNPTPSKWALQQMGLIQGGIRLPLLPLSQGNQGAVKQVLQQLGVL